MCLRHFLHPPLPQSRLTQGTVAISYANGTAAQLVKWQNAPQRRSTLCPFTHVRTQRLHLAAQPAAAPLRLERDPSTLTSCAASPPSSQQMEPLGPLASFVGLDFFSYPALADSVATSLVTQLNATWSPASLAVRD